jgi:5-methylcytosine-specific restriction protein A
VDLVRSSVYDPSSMPILRPCRSVGCPELVVHGWCENHRDQAFPAPRARLTSRQRGYDSQWDRASAAFLREQPWCVLCAAEGRREAAAVVDHIVPHLGDRVRFWERGNWQSLCRSCHSRKTAIEDGRWGAGPPALVVLEARPACQVHVVCGPDVAACLAYVERHRTVGDDLIEVETIASRLAVASLFECPDERVRVAALHERNRRLRALGRLPATLVPTWFITYGERLGDRRHWRTQLGARVLVLEGSPEGAAKAISEDAYGGKRWRTARAARWFEAYVRDPYEDVHVR